MLLGQKYAACLMKTLQELKWNTYVYLSKCFDHSLQARQCTKQLFVERWAYQFPQ